jgi:hypothetical protein
MPLVSLDEYQQDSVIELVAFSSLLAAILKYSGLLIVQYGGF